MMEQLIQETVAGHAKDKKVIRKGQHGLANGNSCSNNLIAFCDKMTAVVDQQWAMTVFCLDIRKVFATVSHRIPLQNLMKYGLLSRQWGENFLNCQTQRVVISGMKSSCRLVASGVPRDHDLFSSYLTSSWIAWMMHQSVSPAIFQITQNEGKWLMNKRVILSSRGSSKGWKNRLTGTS